MSDSRKPEITELLKAHAAGADAAFDDVIPLLYEELRGLAAAQLARGRAGPTLGAPALVHEAYLRLVEIREVSWSDRVHFFAVAATTMRRVLVDHARARGAAKRGAGAVHVSVTEALDIGTVPTDGILDLDRLLTALAEHNPRQASVVECRVFAGLTIEETAAALGSSPATVKRDWAFARAWLNRALSDLEPSDGAAR